MMSRPRTRRRPRVALLLSTLAPVLLGGCPLPTPNKPNNQSSDPLALDKEPNDSLPTATALTFDAGGKLRFTGTIDRAADTDVYALGRLAAGDRIVADVQRVSGSLDAVVAVFDDREYLVATNDDRDPDGNDLNPLLDIVLRGDEGDYYLGIIAYPGERSTGKYEVALRIERAVGVPDPQAQLVFLNWAGGTNVIIPNVGVYNLSPFSATDVGLPDTVTERLKDRVQEIVAERYAGFDLIVLNSDDDPEPTVAHSTVYFGGRDSQAFAISQQIDTFNADPSDRAIVYTGSYRGAFFVTPTLEQMAQALGNTVAHEVGHLLGLVHTADCNDLMDTTCANERLLGGQDFSTAELDDSVWPWGYQAAREILGWVLGLIGL